MDKRIEKILITTGKIQQGIIQGSKWVNAHYKDKDLVLIGLLKGCLPFFGQLFTYIRVDCQIDFMTVSSFYGNSKAQSTPKLVQDITTDIKNKHVLLVDDIVDSGLTLEFVKKYLFEKYHPTSVGIITLLNKMAGRKTKCEVNYACFEIEKLFVVGYGLDYQGLFRNLPYIGILKKDYILD